MTIMAVCVVGIVALMLLRVPVAFAFGAGAIVMMLAYGMETTWLMPSTFELFTSFPLLAIPLFTFLGLLMEYAGLVSRLIDFINVFVRRLHGSLGYLTIVGNAIFGAISGSAGAALVTFASIMLPRLRSEGYDEDYSVALIASSAMLSLFIPPSMDMIMFGFVARLNIAACFLATVGPGLLLVLTYSAINFFSVRRFPIRSAPATSEPVVRQVITQSKQGGLIVLIPILMLGGIYGGLFTPTEAAGVGVAMTILVALLYRSLSMASFTKAIVRSATLTGMIMAVLFFMFVVGRILIWQNVVQAMIGFFTTTTSSLWGQLLLVNVLLLIIGMLIDDNSACILSGILLVPVMVELGVNPYHFAGIVMANLGLGLLTPPVAPLLYAAAGVTGVPLQRFMRYSVRFMVFGNVPVILLTTFIPSIATFLPNLVFGTGLG